MQTICRTLLVAAGALLLQSCVGATDLSLPAQPYGMGGLFTRPLIPVEKDTVTITIRAQLQGDPGSDVQAQVDITAPDGRVRQFTVELALSEGTAQGRLQWKAWLNGLYQVRAQLDPANQVAETDESNNEAQLLLPVVIAGRKPHFPWFGQKDYLRWATIWGGGYNKEMVEHWQERGVMPLRWKYGNNYPKPMGEDGFRRMYSDFGGTEGLAVDECGYYPNTLAGDPKVSKFVDCVRGLARAKADNPDKFFLMWHCGTFYPQQAALYRKACDLVVLESYVSYFAPKGLYTENAYNFLDMKMLPARQVDMLNPTGQGPQVITSIDLRPENFNRGQVESIVRHLRRRWPEMRGFGIFGGLIPKDATDEQRTRAIADEQFVDRLCYEYFVLPVVTILPGNVWVARTDEGGYLVQAAVSNIGAMDSGPIEVQLHADGELLKAVAVGEVPAGDSLLENRVVVSARWQPASGEHRLSAHISTAQGATVLDASGEYSYPVM